MRENRLIPAPWRRTDDRTIKTGARYAHPDGWRIEHCGHPTALWPYLLLDPDGVPVLADNGRAWRTARLAALAGIALNYQRRAQLDAKPGRFRATVAALIRRGQELRGFGVITRVEQLDGQRVKFTRGGRHVGIDDPKAIIWAASQELMVR